MSAKLISIAKDFSPSPAGRYLEDGPYSGAAFRDEILIPAINQYDTITIDLDGTSGYGSSFLEETFGGLVRKGFDRKVLETKLKFHSSRQSYPSRIWKYIEKAAASNGN